jgi:hypothetical protein
MGLFLAFSLDFKLLAWSDPRSEKKPMKGIFIGFFSDTISW